jgi:outer membrane protein
MKKLTLIALFAIAGLAASAQTNKGSILLGGSIDFMSASNSTTNISNSTFGLNVKPSYFVINDLSVGLNLGYYGEDKGGLSHGSKSVMPIGINVTKYFPIVANSIYLTGTFGFDYVMRKNMADASDNSMRVGVAPAVTWFPSKNWALSFGLRDIISYENFSDRKTSTFNFTPSTSGVSIGVAYNIAK